MDLQNLEVNIGEEDKVILLVYSLPHSYRNFKDIILNGSGETLSLENVKASLLAKGKNDLEYFSDKQAEGLMLEVEPQKRIIVVYLNLGLDPKTKIVRNFILIAKKMGMKFLNVLS